MSDIDNPLHHSNSSATLSVLRAKLARALGVNVEDVDGEKTLADYGTDSLMAVELRSWMRKDFGADVTVFDMTSGKSIKAVGDWSLARLELGSISCN